MEKKTRKIFFSEIANILNNFEEKCNRLEKERDNYSEMYQFRFRRLKELEKLIEDAGSELPDYKIKIEPPIPGCNYWKVYSGICIIALCPSIGMARLYQEILDQCLPVVAKLKQENEELKEEIIVISQKRIIMWKR